jgi:hypothetical protein
MRDGAFWSEVNPLAVVGGLGEGGDAVLHNSNPIGYGNLLADLFG